MLRLVTLVVTLAVLVLVEPRASAQQITDVDPTEGTVTSLVTISGTNLLGGTGKKPRVYLEPTGPTGKTLKLKVLEYGETTIVAGIKKAIAGDYTLNVQAKVKDLAPAAGPPGGFGIRPPEDLELGAEAATPGEEVELTGRFFGSKRGKVRVGGKKAKVVAWGPAGAEAADGDRAPIDRAVFRMPKKLPNGPHAVVIKTKVGLETAEDLLLMTGSEVSTGGGNLMEADVGTDHFSATSIYHEHPFENSAYVFGCYAPTGQFCEASLTLYLDFQQGSPATAFCTYSTTLAGLWQGDVTVDITSTSGNKLKGTFEGQLFPLTRGPAINVANGSFNSKLQ